MLLFINIYGERQRHKIMPTIRSCEGRTSSPIAMTTSGHRSGPTPSVVCDFKTGMDVSGDDPDLAKTVLTCEGDLRDPAFPNRLTQIICKLKRLVSDDNKKPFQVTKVEPWNSVRVTFNIPRNAAQRLRQLAQRGDNTLRELGILSVQIEGDQVITLTLANSYDESRQQLVVVKSSESVANSVVTSSAVNSSINSELTVNYNTNSLIPNSVSSLVSNNDLIGSPSIGSSVEITRKNIAQYLSQPHIDVVNNSVTSGESISSRVPAFLSPNVVAPINTEPIPFLNSSSSTTVTSQLSTSVSTTSTCSVTSSAGSRLSAVSSSNSLREIQSNYGLFPFASMQHSYQAMHTKHYTSVQRLNQVITTPVPLSQTNPLPSTPNIGIATVSSTITSSNRPQTMTNRDAKNIKVCPSISSQLQQSAPTQSSNQKLLSSMAQAVSQSCTVASNHNTGSANVALTSPLLVNLLQSDATSGHMKGSNAQSSALNQINASNDLIPKRKPRKSRKLKEKIDSETTQSSDFLNTTPLLSSAQTSLLKISNTPSSQKHLPSNSLPQQSGIDSQMQTQSSFSVSNISPHLISIPLNSISRFPSIHPEAQGQPQVVRAGQLPLRSQLARPQISATKVGSTSTTTKVQKPLFVTTSQELISKPFPTTNIQSKPIPEQKSSPNPNSANNNKSVTSGNESNAVFSSPPPSRMTGKTKHLINPFTGLLEPMLSDEEEEDRPSPATLFPELDAGSDVGGNSERSLSDAGSNGKDNNHSSDTDSGLGKSGTDVSSQSSIDVGNCDNTPTPMASKVCIAVKDSMSSSDSTIDRLKLKVKIEKNECLKGDNSATTSSSNSPFPSRSHYNKQKSSESSNSSSNTLTSQTDANPPLMAEPRVPPLHISIRGPNSAVVVSNRRESTSELEMKTNVSKKPRGVRTTRAMSVESGLGTECTNLNKNQRKKLQREQRFLSGGGIVTSALSVCASSPSVESLVDLNQTLSESSFALSLSSTTHSSESVDRVLLQSSDVSSNCAQNKSNDNYDNKDNNNISLNKCVPLFPNEDNNSSQLCAIRVTTDTSIKTSVKTNDQTITTTNTSNSESLITSNKTVPMTTSDIKDNSVSVSQNVNPASNTSNNPISTEGIKESNVCSESSAPTNQKIETIDQTCHQNNEITNSDPTVPPPTDTNKEIDKKESSDDKTKLKPRILPITSVVTVEPIIDANQEPIVSKISRIGRINCISSSIPALVDTQLTVVRNINVLDPTETNSHNYLIESTTEVESNETLEANQRIFSKTHISKNSGISEKSLNKYVVSSQLSQSFDTSKADTNELVVNGPNLIETNSSQIASNNIENSLNSNTLEQQSEDSVKSESNYSVNLQKLSEENKIQRESITNKTDILSEVQREEITDKRVTVSQTNEMTANSQVLNQTISGNNSIHSLKSDSKCAKNSDSIGLNVENSISKPIVNKSQTNSVSEESVNNCQNCEENQSKETKSSVSDETVKQPLQIVIASNVPSLTTTTTTSVFSQLKPPSLESGSRVTLITFKSNLNSPNTSTTGGKTSDSGNNCLSNPLPTKAVPFKLLTIPSGSGGITVRSAANKLVELINSTTSSPVSPLSPNQLQSSGSPIPLNTTSPPVRLLVSKVASSSGVTQTGVPVSVSGNSIGQLVVVKSVVVTNPSPSIKLVPSKTAKTSTVNTPSLLIPVTNNTNIESLNAINNNSEQKSKETSHTLITTEIKSADKTDNNYNSCHQNNDSHTKANDLDNTKSSQIEPVDLTVHCSDGLTIVSTNSNEMDDEAVPLLIKSSDSVENDLSDDEHNEDNILTHSVASDHNYNMKKSSDESEVTEDSLLNLSNSTETDNLDALKDSEQMIDDESKTNDIFGQHLLDEQIHQSQDPKCRPNKRKSSENAAELIKACMGVDEIPKKNSTLNYLPPFTMPSGLSARVPNCSRTRSSPVDNESIISDSSESNHLNKTKNLRIRKNKISSTETPGLIPENNCSSDDDNTTLSWTNKPRLRTGSASKNQRINKQNNNCVKNLNKDKNSNRPIERTKRSRDRDQNKSSSTQRSTRRSRDHNIIMSNTGINLHTSESSSESLHMEIVGLELSNESSNNNYINDPSSASTTPPIITSSLLVKRKNRVGINNNTEQTESSLTKRRRIVKENHR